MTRAQLSPLPALALTSPSAKLTRRFGGMDSVSQVLMMLMDAADQLTAYDLLLVCRLYWLGRKARRERMQEQHERED